MCSGSGSDALSVRPWVVVLTEALPGMCGDSCQNECAMWGAERVLCSHLTTRWPVGFQEIVL